MLYEFSQPHSPHAIGHQPRSHRQSHDIMGPDTWLYLYIAVANLATWPMCTPQKYLPEQFGVK